MRQDPRGTIAQDAMSPFQIAVIGIMIGLNALDGFDVLSISFAAPGISAGWRIERAALGIVLSMELVGMAVGALALGRAADRFGRRRTILACLFVMTTGMTAAALSRGIVELSFSRLVTGLGIGGTLAATNAAVAEAASARWRSLCVVLMAAGYPLGSIIGGTIAAVLLRHFAWPAIFVFGAVATASFIPLVWLYVPESIDFLIGRGGDAALREMNVVLRRMGRRPVEHLPAHDPTQFGTSWLDLLRGDFGRVTSLLTLAYLGQILTFYFIVKWIPKIVVDMGYGADQAGMVLVWASVGGVTGAIALGVLSIRARIVSATLVAAILSALLVPLFGFGQSTLGSLSAMAALTGTATNAGVVGLYALVAERYPTSLRATATGFVIGIGRGGAALAPGLAGTLFGLGYRLPAVAAIMSLGSMTAALSLILLHVTRPKRPGPVIPLSKR